MKGNNRIPTQLSVIELQLNLHLSAGQKQALGSIADIEMN